MSVGDRFLNKLHAKMRNKCSALHADLYHAHLIVNSKCLWEYVTENRKHFVLHCNIFALMHIIMLFEKKSLIWLEFR
jgi:hypothetical protein